MSSSGNSSGEEVDLDKYRKIYESDEHWTLRKVKILFCLHFASN